MRVLLAQLNPVPGSPEANAQRAAETIRRADADLAVLPELYLGGYDLGRVREVALEPDSPPLAKLRAAASEVGCAVAVGFAERRGDAYANSLALIDENGELAAVYRKVQLFGHERDVFEPGDELTIAPLAGLRVGALICFDMEFPEHSRALAQAGAELLLTASANMEPYYSEHRISSQARALDNRLPHLYCNRAGEEAGLRFVGGSRVVRADGTIDAEAVRSGEQLLALELAHTAETPRQVDYLAQLRGPVGVKALMTATGGNR